MMVRVIDHKDREVFVNPSYVKLVKPHGPGESMIWVSGWGQPIRVKEAPDRVSETLSLAIMPMDTALLAADEEQRQQQQTGMLLATIG